MTGKRILIFPGVQGLIFDCDGTLADSMPHHIQAWQEAFAELGESVSQDFLEPLKGMPDIKIVDLFNSRFGRDLDARHLLAEKHRRFRKSIPRIQPIEPVFDLARRSYGRLPMAVASGGIRDNVLRTLETIGAAALFPVVLTADDGCPPKPEPDLFLEAARRMRIPPGNCQVFEDADLGLEAARSAGMFAFDVRPCLLSI